NATVKLVSKVAAGASFSTVSNGKGTFIIYNVPAGQYSLTVTSIGYNDVHKLVTIGDNATDLGVITTTKNAKTLQTVVIKDEAPAIKQKNDTMEFGAAQYKVNPDATGEDLIRKMPGITVDKKSGAVTAMGETVQKVTVDGRDFFGNDATATLRNLPADVIDKIQVFDRLSDQAQLTGFDDGNTTKSINIVTKVNMRNGSFGRIYAGYGTDGRYSAGGNVSFFNGDRRISLIGMANNVNEQNFSSQDLLGVSNVGNRGGGGQRGGRGGNFGGSNFTIGQQDGIASTNSFGINYSDAWGKKIDVTGSYFFNNSNTSNNQLVNQQNIITSDSSNYYNENTYSDAKNYNNRVNFRLTYRIDSSTRILATSYLNFQSNNSYNNVNGINYVDKAFQDEISQTANDLTSDLHGNSLTNQLLISHAFKKRGRSLSLGINNTSSDKLGNNFLNALNNYFIPANSTDTVDQHSHQVTHNNQYSFNLVYTEPLGKKTLLQANFQPSFQVNHADQETFNYDGTTSKYSLLDSGLSNKFNNTYNTQTTGITVRHGDRDNFISAGISYQHSELNSSQVYPDSSHIDRVYDNILGNAFARFKFDSKSNLRVIFRSNVSAPSVTQLQNVINNSNQFFYSTGNPDLQQQYNNSLILRYNYTNTPKAKSFFANIFFQTIGNYIANATYTATQDSALTKTIILNRGSQISKPVNLNGYFNARSFFTYAMPVKFLKSNLNWNGGISYSNTPGLLNNIENVSKTMNYNVGAVLSSNISEYIDFTLSYSANINTVKNTIQPSLNNNYFMQTAEFSANLLTKKGTFFNTDLTNEYYNGLAAADNTNYWLWNVAIGQKIFKKQTGEIKLSVFDLLKQNRSISRNVTSSYIQDVNNQVLQQYFMLTFTYKLKNFGKGKPGNNFGRQRNFRQFGPPGGFPFGGGGPGGPDAPSL
ncbi:MAG TPA: outer membrane beta-barrel protein, partial [Chitinophagaceae bacterium]|nr:outer membrane beta-barrel protein [Chitinophagaceae bacterium]